MYILKTVVHLFAITLLFSITSFAQLRVTSVSPQQNATDSQSQQRISITFDQAVSSTSVAQNYSVFGKWSGEMAGQLSFENGSTIFNFDPYNSFNAGEMVTVSLSKNVLSATGDSLENGYSWQFWVKPNPSGMQLVPIDTISVRQPNEGWIQTYGANAADINGDGFTDYMVPNEVSNDVRIFMNDGAGNYDTFNTFQLPNGARPSTNEAGDFNRDGFIDFAVGNTQNRRVHILLGDGTGDFAISSKSVGLSVRGLGLLDADADGHTDIVTANRIENNMSILQGNGDGTFKDALYFESGGSNETACAIADANNDGIMDVFAAGHISNEILLLLGDGKGNFTFSARSTIGANPWMVVCGDVDKDGNVDVVSANFSGNSISVIRGDGNGGLFPAINYPVGGLRPIAIDLGDIDGDGDLDMISSSYLDATWTIYENDGNGNFINPYYLYSQISASCAVFHDRDNDGDLDMTGIDEQDDLLFVFDNQNAVGIEPNFNNLPTEITLYENYPNPFNPTTTISFTLPESQIVTLQIFDISGRMIKTLVNANLSSGKHSFIWDGRNSLNNPISSGVYFYQLKSTQSVISRKMILMK